jgi:hypothetical protein
VRCQCQRDFLSSRDDRLPVLGCLLLRFFQFSADAAKTIHLTHDSDSRIDYIYHHLQMLDRFACSVCAHRYTYRARARQRWNACRMRPSRETIDSRYIKCTLLRRYRIICLWMSHHQLFYSQLSCISQSSEWSRSSHVVGDSYFGLSTTRLQLAFCPTFKPHSTNKVWKRWCIWMSAWLAAWTIIIHRVPGIHRLAR